MLKKVIFALMATTAFISFPTHAHAVSGAVALIGTIASSFTITAGGIALAQGVTFGSFLFKAAVGLALSAGSTLLSGALDRNPTVGSQGYEVTQSGTSLDHPIIYGSTRVAGVRIYDESTGKNNKFLHRVLAFAGHEIEEYTEIYVNDEVVTLDTEGNVISPSRYDGFITINKHLGIPGDPADADLVEASDDLWTVEHTLNDIAYLYVKFRFSASVFPNGLPDITCTIKGKKLYNPLTGLTEWSDNSALCLMDYITSSYGVGEPLERIDLSSFMVAQGVCDQSVGGLPRYSTNGSFLTSTVPADLLPELTSAMAGIVWYSQGKWRTKPAYWTPAVLDLTEDDLRSGVSLKTSSSRRESFNTVKGTFKGPETEYKSTDYPEVTNPDLVAEDKGEKIVTDLPLPFTNNSYSAQRIANISLERGALQMSFQANFGIRALTLQVGDNITYTDPNFGWDKKLFEVQEWSFGLSNELELQVSLLLRETNEKVFDDIQNPKDYERSNVNLASSFFENGPTDLVAESIGFLSSDGSFIPGIRVEFTEAEGAFVSGHEIQYKLTTETSYRSIFSTDPIGDIQQVIVNQEYDIRVRTINSIGALSPFTETTFTPMGDMTAPSAPTNLTADNVTGTTVSLSWNNDAVSDFSRARLYRDTVLISEGNFNNTIDSGLAGTTTYDYYVTGVDYSGNESLPSATLTVTTADTGGSA